MASVKPLLSSFSNHQIKVWVLAPLLESADANIDYYYDCTNIKNKIIDIKQNLDKYSIQYYNISLILLINKDKK